MILTIPTVTSKSEVFIPFITETRLNLLTNNGQTLFQYVYFLTYLIGCGDKTKRFRIARAIEGVNNNSYETTKVKNNTQTREIHPVGTTRKNMYLIMK